VKIICVGRNYKKHAEELNNEIPKEPVLFIKSDNSILQKRNPFFIPEFSNDVHFEVELIVKINKSGKHISEKFAHRYYDEIGLGIDFTARDLQNELKKKGLPWEKSKSFDGSCVVGKFINKDELGDLKNITFSLHKNEVRVQEGNSGHMLCDIDALIAYISKYFTLKIGDLIFTGTPEGVGKVENGDQLKGYIQDDLCFKVNIK